MDAARLLHVSQPGISRMIRHIEIQLGVSLFERYKHRLVATPEAKVLYDEIENVYRGVQHIQYVATNLRFGRNTTLRVLSSFNVGLQLVPRAIAKCAQHFPQTKSLFEILPTREIVRLLVAEEADLGISSAPVDHPSLEVREIGRWTLVCAAPKKLRVSSAKAFNAEILTRERLVVYNKEAPQSQAILNWLEQRNIKPNVAVEVRSGYSACAMVAAGIGVAFVDDISARAHRPDGMKIIGIPDAPQFPIYSVINSNRPPSRMARQFIDIARQELVSLLQQPL